MVGKDVEERKVVGIFVVGWFVVETTEEYKEVVSERKVDWEVVGVFIIGIFVVGIFVVGMLVVGVFVVGVFVGHPEEQLQIP